MNIPIASTAATPEVGPSVISAPQETAAADASKPLVSGPASDSANAPMLARSDDSASTR